MTLEELKKLHSWMLKNKKQRFICFAIAEALGVSSSKAALLFRRTLYPIAKELGCTQVHVGSALVLPIHYIVDDYDKRRAHERRMKLRIVRMAIKRGGDDV